MYIPYTQGQIKDRILALYQAKLSGVLSTSIDGRAVSFANMQSLQAAIDDLQNMLDILLGNVKERKIFNGVSLSRLNGGGKKCS